MILTRSPHYITVPRISPLTGETCTKYSIYVYVWYGLKTSVPTNPTFTITRKNYDGGNGSEDIDISQISDGELSSVLTEIDGELLYQDDSCQKWVKTAVYYTTGNASDAGAAQLENTDIATRGYGYGISGKNPTAQTVMMAGDIFRIAYGSKFIIPFNGNNYSSVEIYYRSLPNKEIENDVEFVTSIDNRYIIRYLVIDTSLLTSDSRVQVSVEGSTICNILVDRDTRYTNTDVVFFNRYGAQQVLSMRRARVETMDVTSESYERSGFQPSDGYHQFVEYNLNGKTSVQLSSGYVPQSSNEAFKQLLLSDRIWLLNDGVYTPATVKSKSITYKTRENDKLVNYDVTFEHAFYEVNNV